MQRGFWSNISRFAVASTAAFVLQSGVTATLAAQSDSGTATETPKKTTEPVFRVSKLGDRDSVAPSSNKSAKANAPRVGPENRIADSSGLINAKPRNNAEFSLPSTNVPVGGLDPRMIAPKPVSSTVIPADPAELAAAVATPEPANASADPSPRVAAATPHPLDRAVQIANDALIDMRSEVRDYTAVLAKRENVGGQLNSTSYISIKVRCPRVAADGTKVPFSIYMKFLKPKESAGREAIWVEGRNDGKLCVHEGSGLISMRTFNLDPTGFLAMKGQRYPIYEAGIENLIVKLIEKAERDRSAGPCVVNYRDGAEINKRTCSIIELIHDDRRAPFEFHKAQVFIDDELNLPVRYAAYDWPEVAGGEPRLIEEYTYYNIKTNVGLTDLDFNSKNPAYRYP